ncbi:hypothetical protein UAY_00908 [Enterococcus moraviensis ATCC BAA-383]|uniref:Uncharacterized protein n=1 Tax=Enterococcus moraviensis ATCC BAA-383 TaxID=1158609 RepID=R2R4F4_9ENTE|nr:hypothetical protein [Enterococcus moraviensis]EOI02661.1 hypothetical protein UAY_00908 [Enterococcus moraviensis ATCC BAA-383]EOT73962.1 hypothetical protein I586_00958 [Enterococcus moraviensis ATCC BAA-383]OJG66124.1 hypothetical protein RV09_GL000973 [Enterococcus moraviensis]
MKKTLKKQLLICLLYIIIPLALGALASIWIKLSIFTITAILYGIMLIFMVPSDVFFSSTLDYNTKSVNPSYQHEKPDFIGGTKQQLLHFAVVSLGLVVCLLLLLIK